MFPADALVAVASTSAIAETSFRVIIPALEASVVGIRVTAATCGRHGWRSPIVETLSPKG